MKAAILYLPVIHAGHLDFCKRQKPESLYVLGKSLISEFPLLERDLRALSPEQVLLEARAIELAPKVELLEKDNIDELEEFDEIALSLDEIGEELKKRYFSDKNVIFDTAFLRWGGAKSISREIPDVELKISADRLDQELIKSADDGAKQSPDWWRQVGSLVVKDGKIVLQGYNQHYPGPHTSYIDGDPRSNFDAGQRIDLSLALHGEVSLIAEAARKGIPLEGTSMYVTTFPCPNCAMAISKSGIKKVYYRDGYSLLNAQTILQDAGVALIKVVES